MNQQEVGAAVAASGLHRDDIFITTKISPSTCTAAAALAAVHEDLRELGLQHVDLMLHHFPCKNGGADGNVAVWKGLQSALAQGSVTENT